LFPQAIGDEGEIVMKAGRALVVVADDFGIGPETSRGILDLAIEGRISATVLLVNSPYAESAVAAWNRAYRSVEIGWHPCLTLDRPILPPDRVPSLVDADGDFRPLGQFIRRVCLGRIRPGEVAAELRAQYDRFRDLVGQAPRVVNTHQHISLFPPVGRVLCELLADQHPRPFVRRVMEPARTLTRIHGARVKRSILAMLGRRAARRTDRFGFPGCALLAGVTDPPHVADEQFFVRWLKTVRARSVELMCHPGYRDETLIGRDCPADNDGIVRRVHELNLLRAADFSAAALRAGFRLTAPAELSDGGRHASAA
jgi:predicted glycoside hydrolase/deacetylase ChbG (UPF0249 family)